MKFFDPNRLIAGCDEAGRGCLAGPVVAAAVILPKGFPIKNLRDSKKLTHQKRLELREIILAKAIDYKVAMRSPRDIERQNILWASISAMHDALDGLTTRPEHVIVDGNRFKPYGAVPYTTVVKGDDIYASISAASILAKTYRDEHMCALHRDYPAYNWESNKGYPTLAHRQAIMECGSCEHHRMTFKLLQPTLFD